MRLLEAKHTLLRLQNPPALPSCDGVKTEAKKGVDDERKVLNSSVSRRTSQTALRSVVTFLCLPFCEGRMLE
jgi:hypothetical protein